MKCPTIACLYPSATTTPFPSSSHPITAALALPSSSSLFTASSDGSILFWSLSSPLRPLSVLCGHSSPVTALALSNPNLLLISASSDSLLCAWSSSSPHRCRRRRHLPPSAGSPLRIRPLPSSPHHLCVLTAASLVVIDDSTLNIVRTLANLHPQAAVGPSFAVRPGNAGGDGDDDEVVLVDSWGRVSRIAVAMDAEKQDSPVSTVVR